MKRLYRLSLAFLFFATHAHAEVVGPGSEGIVWSLHCDGYLVQVPDGWVLDNRIAARQGVDMFFLPEEAPRKLSSDMPVYAYVMPTVKSVKSGPQPSVQGLIDFAVQDFKRVDASAKVIVSKTGWGLDKKERKITLVHMSSPVLRKYEAIAYDEDDLSIFAMTISANSPELLAKKEDFLKQIVSSAMVIHTVGARPPCPVLPAK